MLNYKSSSEFETVRIVNQTATITNFFECRATLVHLSKYTSVIEQQDTNCDDLASQTLVFYAGLNHIE